MEPGLREERWTSVPTPAPGLPEQAVRTLIAGVVRRELTAAGETHRSPVLLLVLHALWEGEAVASVPEGDT